MAFSGDDDEDILDHVRRHQELLAGRPRPQLPQHQPEMLYIGCVDARLDPIADIGIEKGKALILRNIAALVPKGHDSGTSMELHAAIASGEIPQNASIGAVLEFFLNHIPQKPGKIKHIVVSGHTDCGGLKTCQQGHFAESDHYLPQYLGTLKEVMAQVMLKAKSLLWGKDQELHGLEEESVRQSVANLRTYPAVREAMEKGTLQVHGWVIDTATQRVNELNADTQQFEPMVHAAGHGTITGTGTDRA
ncbi:MAG: hypothetical protein EBV03_00900 [Proteobacteria bacterium]|nr:hypothetical protein [Pseudomonadota bacterium]